MRKDQFDACHAEIARLRAERTALREALEFIVAEIELNGYEASLDDIADHARAALARTKQ